VSEGGLDITMLIYRHPSLPMVRQKCLDLIANVATVPDIAAHILRSHACFLDHLLVMVRDGDLIADKIPALSVLIRLLKLVLTERMSAHYMKLVDMQYIDCLVDIFESPHLLASMMDADPANEAADVVKQQMHECLPFFVKFEFISMQSLTVILGDAEYSHFWSDKAK
jgi:hypothetical protein